MTNPTRPDPRADKVREIRLRRTAERRGLVLRRSRRRDHLAPDYGRYWLYDGPGDDAQVIAGGQHGLDLDGIEKALNEPRST